MSTTWHDDYTAPGWQRPSNVAGPPTLNHAIDCAVHEGYLCSCRTRLRSISFVPAEQALRPEFRVTVGAHDSRPVCTCVGGPHGGYTCPEC